MVTKQDLINDDEEKARREAIAKAKRDEELAKWKLEQYQEHCLAAETLVEGELGDVIKQANNMEYKGLKLSKDRNHIKIYKPIKEEYTKKILRYNWDVPYSDFIYHHYSLPFNPKPSYEPTQTLVQKLQQAGFESEIETCVAQNTIIEHYGDGEFNVVDVYGTHEEYWLVITWL